MDSVKCRDIRSVFGFVVVMSILGQLAAGGFAVAAAGSEGFPETFLLRMSAYGIRDADTDLAVLSSENLGTGFSFVDDLGGDQSLTIPRIDGHYRIDERHRIEFGSFRIERDGRDRLDIDLEIGDQSYTAGDTVISEINYELLKVGYAYSFYRSQTVELSATAGLNATDYAFDYRLVDGTSAGSSRAAGVLPMFGIRMAYEINPGWSLHYLSEVLFVEGGDVEGSLQNYELEIRYRFARRFLLGVGLTRFSIDVTARDPEWNGRIADTHQGILVAASYLVE
ncbi:MAG: hypothetical protein OEO19_03840 [Gammaproteobacteria bacterium]|nr:hypothetical protein [Gammaproteobacteria bacterium]MDH3449947.1 hypothetical protein [Gammaproteobacteria bacterium]